MANYSSAISTGAAKMGVTLSDQKLELLVQYLELFIKWNKAYNLTSVRDPSDMLVKHIMDSLMVGEVLEGKNFIDVGTGQTNLLSKIVSNFHIEYTPVIGDEFEREDNLANINVLKDYGWSPKTDVFEYIKEHRNVN